MYLHSLLRRQQHSPAESRLYKRKRTKAPARTRGNFNRRLVTIKKGLKALSMFAWRGVLPGGMLRLVERERLYHYTKGYRNKVA